MRRRCNKSDHVLLVALSLVVLVLSFQLGPGNAEGDQESQPANPNAVEERGIPLPPLTRGPLSSPCPIRLGTPADRIAGGPELCISGLTLSPTRHVAFTIRNIGARNTGTPFAVDVYLNNVKTDSIPMADMGSQSALTVEASHALLSTCQPALVRVVIDPQQSVHEQDRSDNDYAVNWALPCPDVTAEISQNKVNHDLQYYAHIKVVNYGGMPMPPITVRTLGMTYNPANSPPIPSSCIQNFNCDVKDGRTIGPLAPGQNVEYDVDPKFLVAQTLVVEVAILCSPPNNCMESNPNNNTVRKIIGPH